MAGLAVYIDQYYAVILLGKEIDLHLTATEQLLSHSSTIPITNLFVIPLLLQISSPHLSIASASSIMLLTNSQIDMSMI